MSVNFNPNEANSYTITGNFAVDQTPKKKTMYRRLAPFFNKSAAIGKAT